MSDTPRTDAVAQTLIDFWQLGVTNTVKIVPIDFARELERENNRLREALQELLADCDADLKPTAKHPARAALAPR